VPHLNPLRIAGVSERPVTIVVVKRVAFNVPPVSLFQRRVMIYRPKCRIVDDALSLRGPHIRDQNVRSSVAVIIDPRSAHTRSDIIDPGLFGHIPEMTVRVAIEILAAEIVRDVKIWPAIAIVVAPRCRKREAIVVVIHTGRSRDIFEVARRLVQPIPEQKIGRTIASIVIRHRIPILSFALEIKIAAEIKVEPSIAIVIRRSDTRECALRLRRESKRIRKQREPPLAVVEKEHRLDIANDHQILMTRVPKINEKRADGVVQNVDPRSL